jgi:ABC-2 type transport system ATP-binding protein
MSQSPAIVVDSLHKTYREGWFAGRTIKALRGVSLEVDRGTIFGLLGPNGAGKTTLIKVLIGIVRKTSGSAQMLGYAAGDRRGRERVGYLPETHRIPRHHTANSALDYYGNLSGLRSGEVRRRREALLDQVGLKNWGNTPVGKFSKGMQQRLGLAQAMLHEPDLLILDEPTDGVDPVGRAAIREVIEEQRQRGVTVFLNSHLLMEVERMCDRVLIIDKGRVLRLGSLDDLTPRTNLVRFELEPLPSDLAELSAGLGQNLQVEGQGFSIEAEPEAIDALVDRLRARGVSIRGLSRQKLSLEATFIESVVQTSAASGGRP